MEKDSLANQSKPLILDLRYYVKRTEENKFIRFLPFWTIFLIIDGLRQLDLRTR